jgi:hypothetical protein
MNIVWAVLGGSGMAAGLYGLVCLWCRRTERRVLAADAARRLAPDRPTAEIGGRAYYTVNNAEEFKRLFGTADPNLWRFPKVRRP